MPPKTQPSVDAEASLLSTLKRLWPYIWPSTRGDLKQRVVIALALMLMGKIITVWVPYTYKWATDALAGSGVPREMVFLTIPIWLVIAYGLGRVASNGFNQLRDGLFASVGQFAVRSLAQRTAAS